MLLRLRCPECSTAVRAPEEVLGKTVRCPKCKETFRAAEESEPAGIQQAPAPKATPNARTRPAPADEPAPVAVKRRAPSKKPPASNRGLILGVVGAVAAVFFLFVVAVGGLAAWLLWPRSPSGAPPSPAVSVATLAQPGAQPLAPDAPAAPPDISPFHLGDVRKSVVFIRRSTPGHPTSTGSGFVVRQDGLIATNRHVVQSEAGPDPASVLYVGVPSAADPDVLDYFKGQVAYVAPTQDTLDFALVKIAARPGYQAFRPLPLASTKLDLGAPAAAIGFPFAQVDNPVLSFNKGSISAVRVAIEDRPYYQTDAAVNHGNSGGPLVNTDGQAVGIVSRGIDNANNMSYALYLSETGMPSILNQEQIVRLQPEAGPLDAKQLPPSSTLKPTSLASWETTRGEAVEEKGAVVVQNHGASFWLTNKTPLPENFQLKIACYVVPVLTKTVRPGFGPPGFGPPGFGPPGFGPQVNMNTLGSLYVRFGTDATNDDVLSMSGTTVHLSAAQLQVAEGGVVVATAPKGVPHDLFLLTVTRRGDELTLAVNDEVWTTQKLKGALQGSHKFSIGGFQSALILIAATVAPVDGPPVPPPVAVVPPKVEPPKPDAKLWAVKPPADWKGPEWTADLDKMKTPDAPASGWVMGGDFKVEEASINPIGWLTLRQGQPFTPGAEITIMLPQSQKSLQLLEGKTITVSGKQPFPPINVNLSRTPQGEKLPKTQSFQEFTMKLEFGKGEGFKLPGKIYICFPDEAKSVIAGKFMLESKN